MINPVQEYAWGSRSFIPELLGESVPSKRPQAELWMGAHPKAPSLILWLNGPRSLQGLIQEYPLEILGGFAAAKFHDTLPFLFKVLAVERSLSLQTHPDREQARAGMDREDRLNIPMNDPRRNYRDGNPKPELLCALTPFTALKGFRKVPEILSLTAKIPSLDKMARALGRNGDNPGPKEFFGALMTAERPVQERIIAEAVAFSRSGTRGDPAFPWLLRLHREYPGDVGVLCPLFLRPVELAPGEAFYIRPGEPHAYLQGSGVEVMANSDNVLRGGLTPKHVDIPEFLKTVGSLEGGESVLKPERQASGEAIYPCPAEQFRLSVIDLPEQGSFQGPGDRSVEIMICLKGGPRIVDSATGLVVPMPRGSSVLVPAAAPPYRITGPGTIYKVSVPRS